MRSQAARLWRGGQRIKRVGHKVLGLSGSPSWGFQGFGVAGVGAPNADGQQFFPFNMRFQSFTWPDMLFLLVADLPLILGVCVFLQGS